MAPKRHAGPKRLKKALLLAAMEGSRLTSEHWLEVFESVLAQGKTHFADDPDFKELVARTLRPMINAATREVEGLQEEIDEGKEEIEEMPFDE